MECSKKDKLKLFIKIIFCIIIIVVFIIQSYKISKLNDTVDILGTRILNLEQIHKKEKYAHLSIDDTISIFEDLYKNEEKYDSIFDNNTLKYFKVLHETYGVVISCYCWYEDDDFNLSMLSDKYANEFKENSNWLRFGFHAYDRNTKYENDDQKEEILQDYTVVTNELIRITGGTDSINNIIRLHYFAGSEECVNTLKNAKNGIIGLLTADKVGEKSYYFEKEKSNYIYTNDMYNHNGIIFINTDFRMENCDNIDSVLREYKENKDKNTILEFFTHEWKLNDSKVKKNINAICEYAIENEYLWGFGEDLIK